MIRTLFEAGIMSSALHLSFSASVCLCCSPLRLVTTVCVCVYPGMELIDLALKVGEASGLCAPGD